MIDMHNDAVSLFQKEADSGQDPSLKAFAAPWLPMTEHHVAHGQMRCRTSVHRSPADRRVH